MLKSVHIRGDIAEPLYILDLGAGTGKSERDIYKIFGHVNWVGLDIENSPEVSARVNDTACFVSYDGENIPFAEGSFDLVFSNQVLEHVRNPDHVVSEVYRVLKSGGRFVGSCSFLEPYHSFSVFNWSPYAIYRIFHENGLSLSELRPGIDGISLIFRSIFGKKQFSPFFGDYEGIFNHFLNGKISHKRWDESVQESVKDLNFLKLRHAGHIVFSAYK
jgi:SAM-dependent methyltransferase